MSSQHGITYLWILFLVFLLGLGIGKTLDVYSSMVQREREAELVYVGNTYREAIKRFYLSSPGGVKEYPRSLNDLLRDPRHLTLRRYIRMLYPDPINGKAFIPLYAPRGGIWGVRSSSDAKPWRTVPIEFTRTGAAASAYQQWHFIYADGQDYM